MYINLTFPEFEMDEKYAWITNMGQKINNGLLLQYTLMVECTTLLISCNVQNSFGPAIRLYQY